MKCSSAVPFQQMLFDNKLQLGIQSPLCILLKMSLTANQLSDCWATICHAGIALQLMAGNSYMACISLFGQLSFQDASAASLVMEQALQ